VENPLAHVALRFEHTEQDLTATELDEMHYARGSLLSVTGLLTTPLTKVARM